MSRDEVLLSCVECGRSLRFRIENEVIVQGEGRIACNIPGAVCLDCVESLLNRVADPPGLVYINRLSPILAREILRSFVFMLPRSEFVEFFATLFPEVELE